MRIVIATPVLYSPSSPFNHLFKDIIGGFLADGNQVIRLVAIEKESETEYKYGYEDGNIEYKLFKRRSCDHGNLIVRYMRDTMVNIREARAISEMETADVLFEDVSYSSFWAVRAAKKKGLKIVAMLQDVWPDNAVQSRIISTNSFLYLFFEKMQTYIYKNADRLICISDDMRNFIVSKGVEAAKIDVIYNWGYSDESICIPWEENRFVKKYQLEKDNFYVIYAGNIGKMQNVEVIVNAAKELQNRTDIMFLIIGNGAEKRIIEEMTKGLNNIRMFPMQPDELAVHIYSAAGVNLIPLVADGIKTAMPSKTGVALSCGRPVICTFGSESCFVKMIKEAGAGVSVDWDDYKGLAKEILRLKEEPFDPVCAYAVYKRKFKRTININHYIDVLKMVR